MGVRSLSQEDPLEEGLATHVSFLAWRAPWTEEPGRLQSRVSKSRTRLKRLNTHTKQVKKVWKHFLFLCYPPAGKFTSSPVPTSVSRGFP